MTDLQKFFARIHIPGTDVQIGQINTCEWRMGSSKTVQRYLDQNPNKDLYFLANIITGSKDRPGDGAFNQKRYIAFDFDIRKEYEREATDDRVKEISKIITDKLDQSEMFKDWSYNIFTGSGVHIYYIGDPVSITALEYSESVMYLQKEIHKVCGYKPDAACINISRIFRVPTSFNQHKKKDDPICGSVNQGCFLEIRDTAISPLILRLHEFKNIKPVVISEVKHEKKEYLKKDHKNIFDYAFDLDARYCLSKLSGSAALKGQNITFKKRDKGGEHIYVDGDPADAWIDSSNRIASPRGKGGGPSIVQWLFYPSYGYSAREVAEILKDNFSDMLPLECLEYHKNNIPKYEEPREIIVRMKRKRTGYWTWGTRNLDNKFAIIKPTSVIFMLGEKGKGKSTFTFDQAIKNCEIGHKVAYISVEMTKEELVDNAAENYAGITPEDLISIHRDNIPLNESKKYEFEKRRNEINAITNLVFGGFGRGSKVYWKDIENKLNAMSPEGFDLIFIDHWKGIKATSDKFSDEEQKIEDMLAYVDAVQTPISIMHHFRKGKNMTGFRDLDEVEGVGGITRLANYVVQIQRSSPKKVDDRTNMEKAETYLYLQKARGGKESIQTVYFNKGSFNDEYIPLLRN